MEALLCLMIGYLVGTFNPSYLLGRLNGLDIREEGSGNAGASNVIITFGKAPGAVVAFIDVLKTVFVINLCIRLFPGCTLARPVAGTACVLGHIFPFYMHFRGGKGLACLGGIIVSYDVRLFLIMFMIALLISFVTDYICFVPIIGSLIYPLMYGLMTGLWLGSVVYCILPVVMCYRHIENLKRIRNGTEARFSFLWNKAAEIDRLKQNNENHK